MLRLPSPDQLTWFETDIITMSRILGPEWAVKQKAPAVPSIPRLALRNGLQLSPKTQAYLAEADALVKHTHALKRVLHPSVIHTARRLWLHQRQALHFMHLADRPSYLLADQPGVGKTPVAIFHAYSKSPQRVLILCPGTAKPQWRREIKRWLKHDVPSITIVEGKIAEQIHLAQEDGWVIAHWEALVHAREGFLEREWDVVIADEAHTMRNREAQRTMTAFDLDATHRLAMTGHPYAKSPDELWSLLHWLYPKAYTSFWRFFYMHVQATPRPFGGFEIDGPKRPNLLAWEIAPFTMRRLKKQVYKTLPKITRIRRDVSLTPGMLKDYKKLQKEFFVKLEGAPKTLPIPSVLARTTRIRQFLVDPQILNAKFISPKYEAVREIMDEIDAAPVIFTMFRQAAERLHTYLGGSKDIAVVTGGMKAGRLDEIQERFRRGKLKAVIIVTQAGGTALNFGGKGYVIHMDLPPTARDLEQTEGRVDRPEEGTGKLVATTAYAIITTNTYEERQIARLERRHKNFNAVFTRSELEALFA